MEGVFKVAYFGDGNAAGFRARADDAHPAALLLIEGHDLFHHRLAEEIHAAAFARSVDHGNEARGEFLFPAACRAGNEESMGEPPPAVGGLDEFEGFPGGL